VIGVGESGSALLAISAGRKRHAARAHAPRRTAARRTEAPQNPSTEGKAPSTKQAQQIRLDGLKIFSRAHSLTLIASRDPSSMNA